MRTLTRSAILCAVIWLAIAFVVSCAENDENQSTVPDSGSGSIVVSSLTVNQGQQDVVIPIVMTNDFALRGVSVPLQVRQLDAGAFITSLKMSFSDRLPVDGLLSDIRFTNLYLEPDGKCKGRASGGYATIAANDTLAHDIGNSPVGMLFFRQRLIADDLPTGADNTGSFLMTVNVTNTAGRFEIDTTCANPANHLLLIKSDVTGVVPTFTKGTITIK